MRGSAMARGKTISTFVFLQFSSQPTYKVLSLCHDAVWYGVVLINKPQQSNSCYFYVGKSLISALKDCLLWHKNSLVVHSINESLQMLKSIRSHNHQIIVFFWKVLIPMFPASITFSFITQQLVLKRNFQQPLCCDLK